MTTENSKSLVQTVMIGCGRMAVRSGEIPNPSPPEVGLRMARLWDAIQASAAQDGKRVDVGLG